MFGGKYMIRKIKSGEVEEMIGFPVGPATRTRNKRKKGSSSIRKQDENDRDAIKRLARTINSNYKPGDLWITLTYNTARLEALMKKLEKSGTEATMDNIRKAAIHERDLFLRRVNRNLASIGLPLKYIAVTSDIDGKTGELARIHHHIITNKEAFEFIFKQWSEDEVDKKSLRDQKDYTPIATYLIKQVRRQPDARKYSPSRNLKKPEITEQIISFNKELKPPKGATIVHRKEYDIESPTQYIRYIAPPKKQKIGGKRE